MASDAWWKTSTKLPDARAETAVAALGAQAAGGRRPRRRRHAARHRRRLRSVQQQVDGRGAAARAALLDQPRGGGHAALRGGRARRFRHRRGARLRLRSRRRSVDAAIAAMPAGSERGAAMVAALGNLIYVAGGLRGGASVGDFAAYDTAADQWSALPALPVARDHGAGAVVGGIFLRRRRARGRSGRACTPLLHAFDPVAAAWSAKDAAAHQPLLDARSRSPLTPSSSPPAARTATGRSARTRALPARARSLVAVVGADAHAALRHGRRADRRPHLCSRRRRGRRPRRGDGGAPALITARFTRRALLSRNERRACSLHGGRRDLSPPIASRPRCVARRSCPLDEQTRCGPDATCELPRGGDPRRAGTKRAMPTSGSAARRYEWFARARPDTRSRSRAAFEESVLDRLQHRWDEGDSTTPRLRATPGERGECGDGDGPRGDAPLVGRPWRSSGGGP